MFGFVILERRSIPKNMIAAYHDLALRLREKEKPDYTARIAAPEPREPDILIEISGDKTQREQETDDFSTHIPIAQPLAKRSDQQKRRENTR